MGQINTNNYPTVDSLSDVDLLIVESAVHGTGTTTPKQLRENAIGTTPLQTSAQTVTGAINELKDEIGTDTLQTLSQTVKGAVNELKNEIDVGAGVVRYDVDTITSGYLGQFNGSANLLLLHLTTDGTADVTNGYMMLLSYSRPVARLAYGRLVDADGVAYKQDVYADNTIICTVSNSGTGTESDPKKVVILGILNVGFTLTPAAVVSDRDIIDGQGNTLSVLAEALTKTASGNPVVISDCAGGKARSLKTTINAIQDLHGQSAPYVGGAGKNKLPMTVSAIKAANTLGTWSDNAYTLNGVTFTILTDSADNVTGIKANGTASAATYFTIYSSSNTGEYFQNKILSGCPTGGSGEKYSLLASDTVSVVLRDYGSGVTITNDTGVLRFQIQISSGYTANNVAFYPMVRLATESDASFAPWENKCPISGRTAVTVDDVGKNLVECKCATFTSDGVTFTNNGDGSFKLNGTATGNFTIRLDQSVHNGSDNLKAYETGSYTLSGGSSKFYTNIMQLSTWVKLLDFGFNATNTATATQALSNCFIIIGINSGTSFNNETFKMMIERGTNATAYTPYVTPTNATIQLGTTVYGGTLDVTTGVLTVTWIDKKITAVTTMNNRANGDFYGNVDGINDAIPVRNNGVAGQAICNVANNVSADVRYADTNSDIAVRMTGEIDLCIAGIKTKGEMETYLANNDVHICYALATPFTIQLTPAQLEMLKGYNRVSIEDGSIELGYIAKIS